MSDIDFVTDLRGQFTISFGNNPKKVSGNRALLNRFEITFLTKTRRFLFGEELVIDTYGGDAEKFINRPQVLNNLDAIAAALATSVEQTVESMKGDEPSGLPDTEKLESARVIEIDEIGGVITAKVEVVPVERETIEALEFNLPIVRR